MSSSDRHRSRAVMLAAGLAVLCLGLTGCQVRPLYASYGTPQPKLASIAIDPVTSRVAQQVRNHLIFLFDRGGAEPATPTYSLSLSVAAAQIGAFINAASDAPTAGRMKVTVTYTLRETKTNKVIKTGKRTAFAAYDLPAQEFTKLRAVRDAESRAAKSAAEFVDADLAGFLAR